MKVRAMKKLLRQAGWEYESTRGDHHHFTHPSIPGKLTVPGNDGDELARGTEKSILKQAGLK